MIYRLLNCTWRALALVDVRQISIIAKMEDEASSLLKEIARQIDPGFTYDVPR